MTPEELTKLIEYHTQLHEDAVTSNNPTLAAYHAAMAAAFQMARGPWQAPGILESAGHKKRKADPIAEQLAEMMEQLNALKEAYERD